MRRPQARAILGLSGVSQRLETNPNRKDTMIKIIHNKLLGGWYIVRGPHQAPIGGRFDSKAEAQAWLRAQQAARDAAVSYKRTA